MTDSTRVTIAEAALENPHAGNDAVHYRHYLGRFGPKVICVQSFDYFDYEAERFLSTDAWDTELEAETALSKFLTQTMPAADADARTSSRLKAAGVGLTRLQAVYAFLQERAATVSNTPTPAQVDALNAVRRELALELRTHAWEQVDRTVREHLMRMADVADGGIGPLAHHGCPDDTIPTADCTECAIVLDAEVEGRGRRPTMFAELGQYTDD